METEFSVSLSLSLSSCIKSRFETHFKRLGFSGNQRLDDEVSLVKAFIYLVAPFAFIYLARKSIVCRQPESQCERFN